MLNQVEHQKKYVRQIVTVFIILVFVALLIPQISAVRNSLKLITTVSWGYASIGVGFTIATYAAASATYCFLAFKKLPYVKTTVAEFAAMFINRLLPAGLGAVGANIAYLKRQRHTSAQAITMVATNNILGFLGHITILAVVVSVYHSDVAAITRPHIDVKIIIITSIIAIAGAVILLFFSKLRERVALLLSDLRKQCITYLRRPQRLIGAFISSSVLTLCNILSFYYCLQAVGGSQPFAAVCIIFTFGIGVGAAIPTPGGIGGVEAGLVAGLIAYHEPTATALAAAIVYRLVSYWLTLALGGISFVYASRAHYFR